MRKIISYVLSGETIMTKKLSTKNNVTSTYERLMQEDLEFEKDLNKKYRDFILSELLLALMAEDHVSIRALAKEASVSPSLIQDLRSGKKDNLTLKSFSNIISALGYDIVLKKRGKQPPMLNNLRMAPMRKSS